MLRLRVGMRVIDFTRDWWGIRERQLNIEKGKVLRRLCRVPLYLTESGWRFDHAITMWRDAHVHCTAVISREVKSKSTEKRCLHKQRAAGKSRVRVQSRSDSVARHDAGDNGLPVREVHWTVILRFISSSATCRASTSCGGSGPNCRI